MGKFIYIIMLCSFLFSCSAMAQTGPTGVWQSDLDAGTGQNALNQAREFNEVQSSNRNQ